MDYSGRYPRYTPGERGLALLGEGRYAAVLVAGSPVVDDAAASALARVSTIVIGPRASQARFRPRVAIDTGVAGIHEDGTGYRMDEVPLSLRPPLAGPRSAAETLVALAEAIRARLARQR